MTSFSRTLGQCWKSSILAILPYEILPFNFDLKFCWNWSFFHYEKIRRFKKSTQLPGAGRTRGWHHHGSHTPNKYARSVWLDFVCLFLSCLFNYQSFYKIWKFQKFCPDFPLTYLLKKSYSAHHIGPQVFTRTLKKVHFPTYIENSDWFLRVHKISKHDFFSSKYL